MNKVSSHEEYLILFSEATKEKCLGKNFKAIELYSKCFNINTNSAVSLYQIAKIYFEDKDYFNARFFAEQSVKLQPKNIHYQQLLANIYIQLNNYNSAIKIFQELELQYPNNLDYLYTIAELYRTNRMYEKSISYYDKIELLIGIDEDLILIKSDLYGILKLPKKAEAELKKLSSSDLTNIRYHGILAEFYLNNNENSKAFAEYEKMKELNPSDGLTNLSLASYYARIQNKDEYYNCLIIAFKNQLVPVEKKTEILYNDFYENQNPFLTNAEIINLLNILLIQTPENVQVLTLHIDILILQKNYGEASKQLRLLISVNNADLKYYEQLLKFTYQSRDFKMLLADANHAIEIYPNHALFYLYLGIAQNYLYKAKTAIETFNYGIDLCLGNEQLIKQFERNKAKTYYKMNDLQQALELIEKLYNKDSLNLNVMNDYALYLIVLNINLSKAKYLNDLTLTQRPDHPEFLYTRAYYLYKVNLNKEALQLIEQAISLTNAPYPEFMELCGDIHLALNNSAEALSCWNDAIRYDNESVSLKLKIKSLTNQN